MRAALRLSQRLAFIMFCAVLGGIVCIALICVVLHAMGAV
jgi:hypothetical protein